MTQSGTGYQDDISYVDVYLCYDNNVGTAYFDSISITRAASCTDYEYNGLGNIKKISSSNGSSTTYEYAEGNATDVVGITDEHGRSYGVENTSTHNISGITYNGTGAAAMLENDYSYNDQGQMTDSITVAMDVGLMIYTGTTYNTDTTKASYSKTSTATDERGNVTRYFYYDNGLLKGITGADNKGIIYTYNSYGQMLSASPAIYASGQISEETALANNDVDYTYNGRSELESIETNTVKYEFSYDVFGNIAEIKADNKVIVSYAYEANNGNLSGLTYGNGDTVAYTYDELDRVIKICYDNNSNNDVEFTYSPNGQISAIEDKETGVRYSYYYDGEGKLIQERALKGNTSEYTVTISYDDHGRVTGKEAYYPKASSYAVDTVAYIYDSDGNISSVVNATGSAENYIYDDFGRLTENSIKVNGSSVITDTYEYINRDSSYTTGYVDRVITVVGSQMLMTAYTYDVNGNITAITYTDISSGAVHNVSYVYDSLGQLVRENNGLLNRTYTYTYDSAGNILTKNTYSYTTGTVGTPISTVSYGYGTDDKVISVNGNTITYDNLGNPTSYYNGYTFTWDNGRELSSATNGTNTISYKYNYDGIRVAKTVNGVLHEYTLDGTTIVREIVYSGNTNTSSISKDIRYYYDASGIVTDIL